MSKDMVNHPPHYTSHPSGVECIQITEHMGFNLGNATKYIWRADLKGSSVQDLEKAAFYIAREIALRVKDEPKLSPAGFNLAAFDEALPRVPKITPNNMVPDDGATFFWADKDAM